MNTMSIERTRKGFPCLWESGGGYSNTGYATIIASKNGEEKTAVYIRRRGRLANGEHALIPIAVGDYVINAGHHRNDFKILVYRMTRILEEEVYMEKVAEFSNGEWDTLPQFLEDAVEAAMEKATCYHCREPHFAKEPVPQK